MLESCSPVALGAHHMPDALLRSMVGVCGLGRISLNKGLERESEPGISDVGQS